MFACILKKNNVETFHDIKKIFGNDTIDNELKGIPGVGNAGINYFHMLIGDKDTVKPDVHIMGLIKLVLNRETSFCDTEKLIKETAYRLYNEYPNIAPRTLDHIIWKYMKDKTYLVK